MTSPEPVTPAAGLPWPSPADTFDYRPAMAAGIAAARRCNIAATSTDTPEVIGQIVAADVLKVAAPALRAEAAAAERERWLSVLADHYLMGISCDPDTKRDNPMCGCSRVFLGWHPSIGEARQAWIDHAADCVVLLTAGQ